LHLPLPRSEARRDRRVPHACAREGEVRRGRDVREAADRPARRRLGGADRLRVHQRQEAQRVVRPRGSSRFADADARRHPAAQHDDADPEGLVPDDGRQPELLLRLARVGARAAQELDRRGLRDLLAAEPHLVPLMRRAVAVVAVAALAGCSADTDTRTYRVPSSSMEPTLHCARPNIGCEADEMDRVAAAAYGRRKPERGDIVIFKTPPAAVQRCGEGGTYIKRLIGLPGDRWSERRGYISIDGKRLDEPYVLRSRRDDASFRGGPIPPNRDPPPGANPPPSSASPRR